MQPLSDWFHVNLPSGFIIEVNVMYFCRGFTVKVHVKVAPMERTAPWSAPVKTLSTARLLTGNASVKRVKTSQSQWQSMLDLLTDWWMHDWSKTGDVIFYQLCNQSNVSDGVLCVCRLAGDGLFHPLLSGNLGSRMQRHLPLHQRGKM